MTLSPLNRIVNLVKAGVVSCLSYIQHLVMKAAVAISLKLCIFTAQVLLNASSQSREQIGQS
jgi:hypothetical protein